MLKACIVGCGAIAPLHANALGHTPDGVLYAACDIVPEKADAFSEKFNCKALYSFDDVISDAEIDVVHLCTPHYLHVPMAVAALSAGKDVVLEKPVALSHEDLASLISAEEKTGKHICICLQNRMNASTLAMQKYIEEHKDELGKLLGVSGTQIWKRDEHYYTKDDWHGRLDKEGGSLLCNQDIHLIDLMHLFAGPAKKVRCSISTKRWDAIIETEDTADSLIQFENGVIGIFYGTNGYSISKPSCLELDFENGRLRISEQAFYVIPPKQPAQYITSDASDHVGKEVWGSGHGHVVADYYHFLATGTGSYVSLSTVLPSSRTLIAMYESARSGENWVEVV